jgi:hypothetical protein
VEELPIARKQRITIYDDLLKALERKVIAKPKELIKAIKGILLKLYA